MFVLSGCLSQSREELCDHEVTKTKSIDYVRAYSNLLVLVARSFQVRPPAPPATAVTATFKKPAKETADATKR